MLSFSCADAIPPFYHRFPVERDQNEHEREKEEDEEEEGEKEEKEPYMTTFNGCSERASKGCCGMFFCQPSLNKQQK